MNWSINFDGGIILYGGDESGIITIAPNQSEVIRANVLGLGETTITIQVGQVEKVARGKIFIVFVTELSEID